jgi:hypothetical protein
MLQMTLLVNSKPAGAFSPPVATWGVGSRQITHGRGPQAETSEEKIGMSDQRQSWRRAFEMIGPAQLRLRLELRRNEYAPDCAREAEIWLLEKESEAAAIERTRFETVRRWAIIAGVAAVVAAIAALIAAWPVIKDWIR